MVDWLAISRLLGKLFDWIADEYHHIITFDRVGGLHCVHFIDVTATGMQTQPTN